MSREMSEEAFQIYLEEIRIRYGLEMSVAVERLYREGHLGSDLLTLIVGQSPAQPIVPNNLEEQLAQQKSKRM